MRALICLLVLATGTAACRQPTTSSPASPVPGVRFVPVDGQSVPDRIEAVGTVALQREIPLGFTSAGRVAKMTVNPGDAVRQGEVLAALDTTTVGADLASAKAERQRAADEYGRSSKLFGQGWVTRPRVDNALATLKAADARVRAASFQSSSAVIAAASPGVILARLAEPGQVVAAGAPVLVLGERASGYVLRLPLADRDAARVRIGAPATVHLAAFAADLTCLVRRIGGRSDRATGTFMVEIALPDNPRLRSGQVGSAAIVAMGAGNTTLAVPPAAVFAPRAEEGFVYVFDTATSRVRLRRITIAETGDAAIRVTGGLRRGEMVATSRIDRLTDGMVVIPLRTAE